MLRRILAAAVVLFTAAVAQAANTTPDDANKKLIESRAVEAVIWGMPAVNYELGVPRVQKPLPQGKPDRLFVSAARWQQSDPDAQSRLGLFHGLLQHEGRPRRSRDPARRR